MKGMCAHLQEIIETVFDEQGMTLKEAVGTSYSAADAVAHKPVFQKMRDKLLDGTIEWMFTKKVTNYKRVHDEFIQRFFKYFAEVMKELDKPGSGFAAVIPGFQEEFQFELPEMPEIEKNYKKGRKQKKNPFLEQ